MSTVNALGRKLFRPRASLGTQNQGPPESHGEWRFERARLQQPAGRAPSRDTGRLGGEERAKAPQLSSCDDNNDDGDSATGGKKK